MTDYDMEWNVEQIPIFQHRYQLSHSHLPIWNGTPNILLVL